MRFLAFTVVLSYSEALLSLLGIAMFCCPEQRHAFEMTQAQDRRRLRFVAYSTFVITFLLIVCRAAAYAFSQSLAVKAAVLDSVKDCVVSSLNACLILKSIQPANAAFPFGYGKVEALAACAQSAFLFITGGWITYDAICDMMHHSHSVTPSRVAVASLVVSIILALVLALIQAHVARKTKSLAVLADSAHYRSDVIMNVGAIICLFISFKSAWFDVVLGFCISVYLIVMAGKVGRKALLILMDHSLPCQDEEVIAAIVQASGGEIQALRTHSSGRGEFITLELKEPKAATAAEIQVKHQEIEQRLHQHFPRSFIVLGLARSEEV